MSIPTIADFNFAGQKVLVRVDFNVPLNEALQITDDSRMTAAIPTIQKVLIDGGSAILMSHLGRPKAGPEDKFSLRHLVSHLEELTGVPVLFANDCIGDEAVEKANNLKPGEILLLENLRFYSEETQGDFTFAKKLAALGSFYVNDAFGTAHRAHASTTIIAQFFDSSKCIGDIMSSEISNAEKVLQSPQKPFVAIVGGAKVSDKLLILENLMNLADTILIGGGMAYTFLKARGGKIGNSLCEDERLDLTLSLMKMAQEKGVRLMLPEDSVCADGFTNDGGVAIHLSNAIPDGWMGLDIGPESVKKYIAVIAEAHTILWNGPMGVFEFDNFSNGTRSVAHALANQTDNGAFTLIGGGDSAAAINAFALSDRVSYVSTGGGALLEYFEGKELPGIAAILA
ncbi:MAG: phosphoglycerate kinase [Bacteroidia bacterium]|jgi:phosphoglycerate kinase